MNISSIKGIIALDIDGTVTDQAHSMQTETAHYLKKLIDDHWSIIFVTGRSVEWAVKPLSLLKFPYTLAAQNGAILIEMPQRNVLFKNNLNRQDLLKIETICLKHQVGFVVYSGYREYEQCYYNPHYFSESSMKYAMDRSKFLKEKWITIANENEYPAEFASVKCFVDQSTAFLLREEFENELGMHAPPNRDPYCSDMYVVQITHQQATKGNILKKFIELSKNCVPLIVAGDDYNDMPMLELANIKVVMQNAPSLLIETADIIAPFASEQGIIVGLKLAIEKLNS